METSPAATKRRYFRGDAEPVKICKEHFEPAVTPHRGGWRLWGRREGWERRSKGERGEREKERAVWKEGVLEMRRNAKLEWKYNYISRE